MTTPTDSPPKRKRGRPPLPGPRLDPMHRARPELAPPHAGAYRAALDVNKLTQKRVTAELRGVVALYDDRDDFQIKQMLIEPGHLHLVVVADNRERLSRGMQGFSIRAARAVHRALDIDGKIFAYRYKATPITRAQAKTPLACDCE